MTKKATLTTITSTNNNASALNSNFNALNDKFDNTVSLDGSTPNAMQADLDMDSNDILNVGVLYADDVEVDGVSIGSLTSSASAAAASAVASANSASAASSSANSAAASAAEAASYAINWRGDWVTSTAYVIGDAVTENGSSYFCIEAHTSGTFATDLAADKWGVLAEKGTSGAGSGDLLASNNLSDVDSVSDSRSNLGLGVLATLGLGDVLSFRGNYSGDLNSITDDGIYEISTLSPTNGPSGFGVQGGLLFHMNSVGFMSDPKKTQLLLVGSALEIFYRGFGNSAWTGWKQCLLDDDVSSDTDFTNDTSDLATRGAIKTFVDSQIETTTLRTEQATTSGTEFDFTSIPAGVNEITVMFDGISLTGTDNFLIQLGDSGGIEATGYDSVSGLGGASATAATTGFLILGVNASDEISGMMKLSRMSGNKWVSMHELHRGSGLSSIQGSGIKTLSAELTQLRLTRTGSNTFDAGAVAINYR